MTALKLLLKNKFLVLFILAVIGMTYFANRSQFFKNESKRFESNYNNVTNENQKILNLTKKEYDALDTKWKRKLDSTMKVYDIKLRTVESITSMEVTHKDTAKKPAVTGTPVAQQPTVDNPDRKTWKIPVSLDTQCWGMKGEILSFDPLPTLNILERRSTMSADLFVTRSRVLGILWYKRERKYLAVSNCNKSDTVKLININFVKKRNKQKNITYKPEKSDY